jgi:hypothetical protein
LLPFSPEPIVFLSKDIKIRIYKTSMNGEEEHIYVIGGKARGKEPLGRERHMRVDR